MLVFSFNHSKPKAFVPLAWGAAVLAGMAAETLITAGVKAGSKAVLKKQADNFSEVARLKGDYEFMGTNPYRNKDGSISLSPTANDRAKMAGLIGGSLIGLAAESALDDGSSYVPTGANSVPITISPSRVGDPKHDAAYNYAKTHFYAYTQADEESSKMLYVREKIGDRLVLKKDFIHIISGDEVRASSFVDNPLSCLRLDGYGLMTTGYGTLSMQVVSCANSYNIKQADDLAKTINQNMIVAGDLVMPSTIYNIYQVPDNMSPDFKMPNHDKLKDKPLVFDGVCPPGTFEGVVTWEVINQCLVDTGQTIEEVAERNIDKYLEKGDIVQNKYVIEDINNIYTDLDYPVKVDDLKPDLIVPVDPVEPGDIVPVDPIDRSLLQIAKESYQYLADTVKSSVDGLTAVTAGATGVITFLGTTMGWLPNEWIVMFSAAFGLGLFAFFFRR